MEVLEGLNILVTISGRKNKLRVYYLSWLKTKILKTESVLTPVICAYISVCLFSCLHWASDRSYSVQPLQCHTA